MLQMCYNSDYSMPCMCFSGHNNNAKMVYRWHMCMQCRMLFTGCDDSDSGPLFERLYHAATVADVLNDSNTIDDYNAIS
jgi:hypothetical protein